VSTPCHRQLQKVFSYSRIIYLVNSHSHPCSCLPVPVVHSVPSILCSPYSFTHSISLPVSSTVYSMSPTISKSVLAVASFLLSKAPFTAPYRCLPVTFPSKHHVHRVPQPRFPILLAFLCHLLSTPCHRQFQKVFSESLAFLHSKVPITSRGRRLPVTFPSKHHVHRVPQPRFPILLAFLCRRQSTPCRQLQNVLGSHQLFT